MYGSREPRSDRKNAEPVKGSACKKQIKFHDAEIVLSFCLRDHRPAAAYTFGPHDIVSFSRVNFYVP